MTLPDGSTILYAETKTEIVLIRKLPFGATNVYKYCRKTGDIKVDGIKGGNNEKKDMIEWGKYFIENSVDDDLVTLNVYTKDSV